MKQTEILTHETHVNGWFPAVYMSCMRQNFRLFHVSNLSVRNFRIFLLMYTGSFSLMSGLQFGLTSACRLLSVQARNCVNSGRRSRRSGAPRHGVSSPPDSARWTRKTNMAGRPPTAADRRVPLSLIGATRSFGWLESVAGPEGGAMGSWSLSCAQEKDPCCYQGSLFWSPNNIFQLHLKT